MKIRNWYMKPAKWYQFWLPQSSAIGGTIFGTVIGLTIFILSKIF